MTNKETNTNQPSTSNLEKEAFRLKEKIEAKIMQQDEVDLSAISEYVPAKKAAAFLGVSLPTLRKFARNGIIQKHTLGKGRKTFYKRSEIMSAFTIK